MNLLRKDKDRFEKSKITPDIIDVSIQGTGVIIIIEPFPSNKTEEQRLKTELEQTIGLQVFLKRNDR